MFAFTAYQNFNKSFCPGWVQTNSFSACSEQRWNRYSCFPSMFRVGSSLCCNLFRARQNAHASSKGWWIISRWQRSSTSRSLSEYSRNHSSLQRKWYRWELIRKWKESFSHIDNLQMLSILVTDFFRRDLTLLKLSSMLVWDLLVHRQKLCNRWETK